MNLLLFRKTTIVSSLTEAELINRLSEIVDFTKRTFSHSNPSKKYVGKIEHGHFKIHSIIKGRNSFIPIIQGSIDDNFSGRSIKLKMRLHFVVILFILWIFALVIYYLIKKNDYNGLFFIAFILGITIFFFNQECNKSMKDLKEIFAV